MWVDIDATGCPDTCRHCARDGRPPYGSFYSLDELRTISDEWGPLVAHCYEPTAHPDFPEIYDPRFSVDHGGYLITNGFGLARRTDYPILLERMRHIGMHTLWLTLHGLREHHDWFVRRKGAFDDIVLATRRAKEAGFRADWQIFIDRKGLNDIPALVEVARQECGEDPRIEIPFHRVSRRLWQYERLRPTLEDILERQIHKLVDDPHKNSLINPENLTAAAWLESWRQAPEAGDFRHPFEPPTWPPQMSFEGLILYIQRDRKVYFDPMCAPPILLGKLSEGRDVLLQRLGDIQAPRYVHIKPEAVEFPLEEQKQLHPKGYSVRNKAISRAYAE